MKTASRKQSNDLEVPNQASYFIQNCTHSKNNKPINSMFAIDNIGYRSATLLLNMKIQNVLHENTGGINFFPLSNGSLLISQKMKNILRLLNGNA